MRREFGKMVWVAVIAMNALAAPVLAQENTMSLGLSAGYFGKYVWRGMPFNSDGVVQTSLSISQGDLGLEVWGSMDTTDWGEEYGGYGDKSWEFTELDYIATWSRTVDKVSFGGGLYDYTFPNTGWQSTTELFWFVSADVILQPELAYYLDVDGPYTEPASYTQLDLSHSFSLTENDNGSVSLDLSGHIGYGSDNFHKTYYWSADGDGFHDWSVAAALPISLGAFTITPGYTFTSLIQEDMRDEVEDLWDQDADNGYFSIVLGWEGEI